MTDQPPPSEPGQPYVPYPPPQQPQGGPYPGAPYQQPYQPYPPQGHQQGYQQGYQPGYGQPLPPLAHWGLRVGAYLVDALVLVPAYLVAVIGAAIAGHGGAAGAVGGLLMAVGYLGAFAIALWNQVFRQGTTGWSIGKRVVGIRLLAERTMQPLGPGLTFVRMIAHVLDAIPCYLGFLWPLWDGKKQTFADKIMSTVVVVQKEGS